ncbi:hypothetical protein [Nocardia neocaledoniensis]|uniref:hypothetical protein n=1 Tax=Nocardia neocaledoniensis TaxID=236511 RepID=UPI002457AD51|nr:hypothetical protein [Nocardia neocaledoniensis]
MAEQTKAPRRAYALWTDEKNAELVEMLRAGVPLEEICDRTGRSPNAIRQHCVEMIPSSYRGVTPKRAFDFLPVLLADPTYDWREPLRELKRLNHGIYWDPDMDAILVQGWTDARPLTELSTELGASDLEVGRRLIGLGLAATMHEVVDRLGFGADDTLPERLRIDADRDAASVCILIVDNIASKAPGHATKFGETGPARRYVSVHAHHDHAARELTEVTADHVRAGGHLEDLTISILNRTVGDRHLGTTVFKRGADLPAAPDVTQLVDLDEVLTEAPIPAEPVDLDATAAGSTGRRLRGLWRRR